jgi:hypothetical protein
MRLAIYNSIYTLNAVNDISIQVGGMCHWSHIMYISVYFLIVYISIYIYVIKQNEYVKGTHLLTVLYVPPLDFGQICCGLWLLGRGFWARPTRWCGDLSTRAAKTPAKTKGVHQENGNYSWFILVYTKGKAIIVDLYWFIPREWQL